MGPSSPWGKVLQTAVGIAIEFDLHFGGWPYLILRLILVGFTDEEILLTIIELEDEDASDCDLPIFIRSFRRIFKTREAKTSNLAKMLIKVTPIYLARGCCLVVRWALYLSPYEFLFMMLFISSFTLLV